MASPPAPLSKSQKKRQNKKLKSELKGNNVQTKVEIPDSPIMAAAHGTTVVTPADGQRKAATATGLEDDDVLETISENDVDDDDKASKFIKLITKRIKWQTKKASRITSYSLKPSFELNDDQKKSVATLPIIQAIVKELEGMREAIESMETEEAKELERRRMEDEKLIQERINQAVSDAKVTQTILILLEWLLNTKKFKEFHLNRFSTIISLIRLSDHLKSPGHRPFPLNEHAQRVISLVVKTLTDFRGSKKDEVLSGLLKGKGEFEGLPYDTILLIANLYRDSQIVEELTNANVPDSKPISVESQVTNVAEEDESVKAENGHEENESRGRGWGRGHGQHGRDRGRGRGRGGRGSEFGGSGYTRTFGGVESEPRNTNHPNASSGTASKATEKKKDVENNNNAKIDELERKLAELERNKLSREEAAQKQQEETIRQAEIEALKCKMAELERDKLLREEAARKREEEIRLAEIEESKRKLAELERNRLIREEAAQKRMHEELIEESKRKLKRIEQDKPLWEAAARKREEQELCKKEEERIRAEKEECEAAERRCREEQELKEKVQEREKKKQKKRSGMFVIHVHINPGEWTLNALLKRYTETAASFDSTKYTSTKNPLKFESIPWPVAYDTFGAEDIEWNKVENFFKCMKGYLPAEGYEDLVDKSHKRFHPDRWRSRGILTSVKDDIEREILEEAGSIVAQALTPLWKQVTGREIN
ncbi:hypothetical protein Clacol_005195 [Clathrus columnatus]|uniref:Uncharacterized protein n=1 Tax=Clathrus columnatus TaxID=1419009 RepID=A0AAV5A8K8_9AGAM|nr:hypothetical protein Clacol_005195 [Clathrus columnatus]